MADLSKGDEYHHPDGTVEIVFAVEEGRVLTVKEYPDHERFEEALADAAYRGVDEEVASLPPAAAFADDGDATED